MDKDVIILDMDEERELKWTFKALKAFGNRAREILRKQKIEVRTERGQVITPAMMNIGFILSQFGANEEIMESAIAALLGVSALEKKDGPSEATVIIDAYLGRGGDLKALGESVYHAYLLTQDPSSVEAWDAGKARDVEIERINREKQDAKMEIARMELVADQEKIAKMKDSGGEKPTASPT